MPGKLGGVIAPPVEINVGLSEQSIVRLGEVRKSLTELLSHAFGGSLVLDYGGVVTFVAWTIAAQQYLQHRGAQGKVQSEENLEIKSV